MSSADENKKRPRSADTDFFERLAELDLNLPVTDRSEAAYLFRSDLAAILSAWQAR